MKAHRHPTFPICDLRLLVQGTYIIIEFNRNIHLYKISTGSVTLNLTSKKSFDLHTCRLSLRRLGRAPSPPSLGRGRPGRGRPQTYQAAQRGRGETRALNEYTAIHPLLVCLCADIRTQELLFTLLKLSIVSIWKQILSNVYLNCNDIFDSLIHCLCEE